MYLYPQADVPVLPLAWSPRESPAALFAFGQSLATLAADGVLDRGHRQHHAQPAPRFENGMHNAGQPEIAESKAFRAWMLDSQRARATGTALFDYRAARAARGGHAPERRAPAALVHRRRRRGRDAAPSACTRA